MEGATRPNHFWLLNLRDIPIQLLCIGNFAPSFFIFIWKNDNFILRNYEFHQVMLHIVTSAIPTTTYKSAFIVALTIIAPVTRVNNVSIIGHNSKKWFFCG